MLSIRKIKQIKQIRNKSTHPLEIQFTIKVSGFLVYILKVYLLKKEINIEFF